MPRMGHPSPSGNTIDWPVAQARPATACHMPPSAVRVGPCLKAVEVKAAGAAAAAEKWAVAHVE
ncbi:MAG: hypothetical protein M1826_003946 [Phylliscum demangeonii]|nr:MAG: hypothetical protein M1826_003946 [Phylliscum demangeonii]